MTPPACSPIRRKYLPGLRNASQMRLAHFLDPRLATPDPAPVSCLGLVLGDEVFDIRVAWQIQILEAPVFYFSNIASITGPGAPIRKPHETSELDYELEVAVVIGREGGDIRVEEADDYIAGFTILNDWSARDRQRREMKVGLGPAKG